jgi:hypothetical protein
VDRETDAGDGATGPDATGPYPPGFTFVEVPDPLSGDNPTYPLLPRDEPAVGAAFTDHHFGTWQTRVTGRGTLRQEYARFDPFNADGSLVLLYDFAEGRYRVCRTGSPPYGEDATVVREASLGEARWDPVEPGVIWGLRDFAVVRLDVPTGLETVVKDFARDATIGPILAAEPDLFRITMKDEGEASADLRYWAFFLQGEADDYRARHLFTWDRESDRVLGRTPIPRDESDLDWVGMSHGGNWVLIGGMDGNAGRLRGLVMADRELTSFHRLDFTTSHADVGLDVLGREVIVMQNNRTDYVDLIPLDPATLPILEAGGAYAGTGRTPLVRLYYDSASPHGFRSGVHVSCNVPGYCLISTTLDPGVAEQNWLDRTNILVRLDPARPRAFYLSKLFNTTGAYWEETHATIARDGSRVMWADNWGRQVGEERVFVMELRLPAGWRALTGEAGR